MNNIGAYRQAAKEKWKPVQWGGGETKEELDDSQETQTNIGELSLTLPVNVGY